MARKGAQRAAKLVPAMRYRNVAAAAEWLCTAFGFETHRLVKGDDGAIAVAQLTVGPTMIMLLPVGGSELDHLMKQPDEIGGAETQKCYLVVDDIDIHYAKAKAGGAQFVLDLKEYENGGRGFSCRDPEGHIWSFGTYDPWDGKSVAASLPPAAEPMPRGGRSRAVTMAAMVAIAVAVGAGGWMLGTLQQTVPGAAEETRLKQEVAAAQLRAKQAADRAAHEGAERSRERSEREAVVRAAQQAREELARGASAKEAAERAARQLEAQLAEERRAKEAAERAAKTAADQAGRQLEAQLAEERRAKEAAERTAKTATDQIAKERTAKQAAQNATSVVQRELALARAARQLAEKSAKEATEQLARERAAKEAAERVAREAQVKSSQAQGAEKGTTQPANPDRSSKKVSKKSGGPGPAESMPPLLP